MRLWKWQVCGKLSFMWSHFHWIDIQQPQRVELNIKGLRQNFVLSFVSTLRPLLGRLKSLQNILLHVFTFYPLLFHQKYTMGIYTSYKINLCGL